MIVSLGQNIYVILITFRLYLLPGGPVQGLFVSDLKTIVDSKSKPERKGLVALKTQLFDSINELDFAAKSKSTPQS